VPGYSGDGGMATAAKLAEPQALAVDAAGGLLICDRGNHRVRRVVGGVITTFAGNGAQGFSGDGGAATAAQMDSPSGVAVGASGVVYVADTHNHRVRAVDKGGVITTIAGTGVAGFSGDGGAATAARLDSPRGLVLGENGALLIADANNQRVRSVAGDGTISTVAGELVQGSASDGASATAASLNTPRGVGFSGLGMQVIADGPNHTVRVITASGLYVPAALASGRTTAVSLSAGASAVVTVTGEVGVPLGSVQLMVDGVATTSALAAGSASFSLSGLAPGSHTLMASYAGDGLNPAALSSVVTVSGAKAASAVATQAPAQTSYAGLPLVLQAKVTSGASTVPTGSVNFMEAGTMVATAQLVAGNAAGVYLAPSAGTHSIAASYLGDVNDLPGVSPAVSVVVQAMPDFAISAGSASQAVAAGSVATYGFSVSPQGGTFSGAVSLSVSGLPAGATASFSPPQVVPGAAAVTSTLTVQTKAVTTVRSLWDVRVYALLLLPVVLVRRRMRRGVMLIVVMSALLVNLGCGERINQPPSAAASNSTLTVTATGTNLAGALVTHSTTVVLLVQ
jgi:hypothetical protein